MSHSWAEDEFTSGAFAQFEPDQLVKLFRAVWQPENRVHYAGEHTSLKHGWIEGAVESGIRVAKEVCDGCILAEKASERTLPGSAPAVGWSAISG
jgi:monoamine oxidase